MGRVNLLLAVVAVISQLMSTANCDLPPIECLTFPDVAHGAVSGSSGLYSTLTLTCDIGYEVAPEGKPFVCFFNPDAEAPYGSWLNGQSCQRKGSEVCDEKDLPYDKVGVASTFRPDGHRDELHLTCKYGYKLRAGAPYTCNISRFTGKTFWAGSQACLVNPYFCPTPTVANGVVSTAIKRSYQSNVTYLNITCNDGHYRNADASLVCAPYAGGYWKLSEDKDGHGLCKPPYTSIGQWTYYLYVDETQATTAAMCNIRNKQLAIYTDSSLNIKDLQDYYSVSLADLSNSSPKKSAICEERDYECFYTPGHYYFLARDYITPNHDFASAWTTGEGESACRLSGGYLVKKKGPYTLPQQCQAGFRSHLFDLGIHEGKQDMSIANAMSSAWSGSSYVVCQRSFAGRDQSFPLVSGPGLDMQSHNYTYEQAAAFCSVRGLSLPLLVTDVQTMAVNTFAAPLEARFQTKLWSSVQNPTEAATSTPPETRGGVICRLPPLDIACSAGLTYFFPFTNSFLAIRHTTLQKEATRFCRGAGGELPPPEFQLSLTQQCANKIAGFFQTIAMSNENIHDFGSGDSTTMSPVLCRRPANLCQKENVLSAVPPNVDFKRSFSYRDASEMCKQQGMSMRNSKDAASSGCSGPLFETLQDVWKVSAWDVNDDSTSQLRKNAVICSLLHWDAPTSYNKQNWRPVFLDDVKLQSLGHVEEPEKTDLCFDETTEHN